MTEGKIKESKESIMIISFVYEEKLVFAEIDKISSFKCPANKFDTSDIVDLNIEGLNVSVIGQTLCLSKRLSTIKEIQSILNQTPSDKSIKLEQILNLLVSPHLKQEEKLGEYANIYFSNKEVYHFQKMFSQELSDVETNIQELIAIAKEKTQLSQNLDNNFNRKNIIKV